MDLSLSILELIIYFAFAEQTLRINRKEVIQPHVPVRLPCYDLAPIASFTLGLPT